MAARSLTTRSRLGALAAASEAVRSRLWPVPVAAVAVALLLGLAMIRIDQLADDRLPGYAENLLFGGDANAARTVLDAVSSSLITVTSLTFSLTVVTLQLASSQFSPRLLRTFAADRFVQNTLGLFLATFVFALTVLRSVRGDDGLDAEFVPRLSVTVAVLLTIASVVTLVLFLAHLAREIRVENVLTAVHRDTAATIRRELEESDEIELSLPPSTGQPSWQPLAAARSGFLILVDQHHLLEAATELDVVVWIDRPHGAMIVDGTPLMFVSGPGREALDDEATRRLKQHLRLASERNGASDVSYGLRQITDVTDRALSAGINDPTTAVHALGHSAAVLCLLARRSTGPLVLEDDDGAPRVILARHRFADLLSLAVAQPRRDGADDPAVQDRILQLLREVAWTARARDRRQAVRDELALSVSAIQEQTFDTAAAAMLDRSIAQVRAALDGTWEPASPSAVGGG